MYWNVLLGVAVIVELKEELPLQRQKTQSFLLQEVMTYQPQKEVYLIFSEVSELFILAQVGLLPQHPQSLIKYQIHFINMI